MADKYYRCFAQEKNGIYTLIGDRGKSVDEPSCYALSTEAFRDMWRKGKCRTKECPFFKQTRKEIRYD